MLRRQTRLRREFIYRKSIEDRERTIRDKKQKLKSAVDNNKMIDGTLRKQAIELDNATAWDDEGGEGTTSTQDDEYRWAGVSDPKLVLTTARDPSVRLKQFAKEMRLIFPNCKRINRGNYDLKQLIHACRANEVSDLVILSEHRGVPDGIIISHLPYGPTAYFTLLHTVMRHDVPEAQNSKVSEAFPHLIFQNLTSNLGKRVTNILKYLFPVPKSDSRRIITFYNNDDTISFRHHTYKKEGPSNELTEVGPRFEMKLFKIIQGTLENADSADVEWAHRPFMRTARKRKFLSEEDD
ncbi:DgyrCDS11252 [Dimorphilus gyrociliatus]|uniref:DgyrCDS11252 n=1 Tax=Dimorphilus gyrociliatus TaxID=2664684 RepID=A0A7I8W2Q4_9ANNE|nr:DgyrCDS11252 [Dimorphilus gyrociliatus]